MLALGGHMLTLGGHMLTFVAQMSSVQFCPWQSGDTRHNEVTVSRDLTLNSLKCVNMWATSYIVTSSKQSTVLNEQMNVSVDFSDQVFMYDELYYLVTEL